jgi:ubiquinone/menaquinone biosynthesis C-methylase UbiE
VDPDEYHRLIVATERHWWFAATSKLLEQLLEGDGAPLHASTPCLDAGGGSGATSSWLANRSRTVLCEYEPVAISAAVVRYPTYLATRGNINRLPFPDQTFDVVMCVTALCHEMNPDPGGTVAELARVLAPGGRLLLLEPNHPWLWRGHDRITHTARRFTVPTLRRYVQNAGLRVVRSTAAFSYLVPPAALVKLVDRGGSTSDVGRHETGLGGLASGLASLERRWLSRWSLPFGLSAVVLAVRTADRSA